MFNTLPFILLQSQFPIMALSYLFLSLSPLSPQLPAVQLKGTNPQELSNLWHFWFYSVIWTLEKGEPLLKNLKYCSQQNPSKWGVKLIPGPWGEEIFWVVWFDWNFGIPCKIKKHFTQCSLVFLFVSHLLVYSPPQGGIFKNFLNWLKLW